MVITLDELKIIANQKGYNLLMIEKDYLITYLLYLIKDIEHIFFKGGTALNKIFLNYERLSEDLDFTITKNPSEIEESIKNKIKKTIFRDISYGKKTKSFTRLILNYKLFHEKGSIYIDLNKNAKLELKPVRYKIKHFYKDIPEFSVNCLDLKEMIAEKVIATAERYKPRDFLDLYWIIKNNFIISKKLILKKRKKFSKDLIFKNTNKVYSKWDTDLKYLIKTDISFQEVIMTLKEYFNYR
ncbi:MAG: nucleotidyl transferase AbiEii/AbiGii toxin family protein [Candidatus Woesearchaeota archaeon]